MSPNEQKAQARSLIQAQRIDEAMQLLLAMYEQDTRDAETWHLLATVNGMLGRFEESLQWSRRVIEKHPQLVDAWVNLATALQHAGKHQSALDAYQRTLKLQPGNVQVQLAAAELHRQLGNQAAAVQGYREAIRLRPRAAELHYNLGTYHHELGDYRQAERCYLEALALKPDLTQARNNLGLVYQEQCRLEDAMQCFNAALVDEEPQHAANQDDTPVAEVHRHRALLWLLQGNFDKGWPEYKWRHTDSASVKRTFISPEWDGSPLGDKSILVSAEQGIGDEIMFASCIPDLQRRAGRLVLECNPRLKPLFERSFPGARVYGVQTANTALISDDGYDVDVHIPAGDVPGHLRRSLDKFPGQAYLRPDPGKLAKWQDRYDALGNTLKVGISWRGGGNARMRKKRSTGLEQWLPVFMLENVQFINLQYGDCNSELQQLADHHKVTVLDWPDADPLQDLDDFAAQVAALDLVISVDNATVHMAGALGMQVWILQPFLPEWRWLLEREESYWYPGVRQFRQPSIGDWGTVFASVRQALIVRQDTLN